ncbi:hypothetical protein H7992_21920 [Sporosarcina sp. resist]|uniref:hypothetical protein n=1 Tax=Sporosarcina sp. resist TaxID=2762563 RepID=UPI00164D625F|nr:hypothetical protein [Sporosarcina sp. resist]QNK90792.1 hypothetical protein H7992_21920 [Sporosarcina sp. resist]
MVMAQVSVEFDREHAKKQFQEKLDATHRDFLITWDVEEMCKRLCVGKTFLEENILRDSRMRVHLRQKPNSKRLWLYEPSVKVIKEIMSEW